MNIYRRRNHSDVWHFCRTCRWWPRIMGTFKERDGKPTTGELCNECIAKRKRGKCEP